MVRSSISAEVIVWAGANVPASRRQMRKYFDRMSPFVETRRAVECVFRPNLRRTGQRKV